jgi:uncharacterized protein
MNKEKIVKQTAEYAKKKLSGESSGHDWWHTYRVWKNAAQIGRREKADLFVVELAALLHDISDWKFNQGDETVGPRLAREWLEKLGADQKTILEVDGIIKDISFKGIRAANKIKTKEGMVVQDADRLDAIGAIGIGRTFAFGGSQGLEMHDPKTKANKYKSAKQYKQYKETRTTTINHFYEKLLLLKDRMNTKTAKKIAIKRHAFLEKFLAQFFEEWNIKK